MVLLEAEFVAVEEVRTSKEQISGLADPSVVEVLVRVEQVVDQHRMQNPVCDCQNVEPVVAVGD